MKNAIRGITIAAETKTHPGEPEKIRVGLKKFA
jgi:hypothetical protein